MAKPNTKIIRCTCESSYQDKKYGLYQRVHNRATKSWRCALCGADKKKTDADDIEVVESGKG